MTTREELIENLRAARHALWCLDDQHHATWTNGASIYKIIQDLDFILETSNVRGEADLQSIWNVTKSILDAQDVQILTHKMKARLAA